MFSCYNVNVYFPRDNYFLIPKLVPKFTNAHEHKCQD